MKPINNFKIPDIDDQEDVLEIELEDEDFHKSKPVIGNIKSKSKSSRINSLAHRKHKINRQSKSISSFRNNRLL